MSKSSLSFHSSLITHHSSLFLISDCRQMLGAIFRMCCACAPLVLPLSAQRFRVEGVARAVAQVFDLMPGERGDQAVGFGARQSLRQFFQLFKGEIAPDARADIAALDDVRSLRQRLIRAVEID